ncbi:penicillin acylase family protein [Streptomyces nondiastaticus]|uniref:penicillin acylase family protein n=1 Tax=Streptomyces nondiastaticus TaxID=3154512 RepID=UPI00342244BE
MEADEEYPVAGLTAPVEILVDDHGVPHLYARTRADVFRAQGFDAARERLFQLDLWRRRGLGRLSEVFGERFVARDRAARLFLYRGDMRAEWDAYGADAEDTATAFTEGINAFVRLCEQRPELLPAEFRELGHRPALWEPRDIAVIRSHGLAGNAEQKAARALTLRDHGPAVEDLRRVREPAREVRVPDGLDLSLIPDDVLDVYRLATTPADLTTPTSPTGDTPDAPRRRTHPEGSNNWVIGPGRTATGRPLLANDPHRAITLPSLRRLVHLSAPGLDAVGAGEPVLPGLSVGHNGHLAFGLTIFSIDQEDLYVYETAPGDPGSYRYDGRWEPMRVVRERIHVAGSDPVEVELRFTRHGPVVREDPARRTAFAVRAAWLAPGSAPYLGSLRLLQARTADAFVEALHHWGAPGENMVYAAPDGTIGWRAAGAVPVRPGWDGLLPVPGDGRYEWAGLRPPDRAASLRNPQQGWFASANEMNLPDGFPHEQCTIGFDWDHRFRYDRIAEVLGSARAMTVEDCVRLQGDTVNASARHVLASLDGYRPPPRLAAATALLRSWDCDETAGSAAAALYQVWSRRHLRPALLRHALTTLVPPEAVDSAMARLLTDEDLGADVRTDIGLLHALRHDRAALDRLLTTSLDSALRETRDRLGEDMSRWRWGALHHAAPAHPLAGRLRRTWTRLDRRERPGSGDTVLNTGYDAGFTQDLGASFRVVVDVGDWDRSRAMNAPGQSGRPDSPHWDDLYEDWARDRAFPLHYSRAAVEAHTRTRIVLVPAPA